MAPNMAATQPAMQLGIRGPVITSLGACAAGTMAMVEALRLIRCGDADVVIAGGTEAALMPLAIAALTNLGALSRRNESPARASRPFDRDRDGFVFSEGAAALVIESEAHAQARGARVLCELAGGAITCDAYHITAPLPGGEGAALAMRRALRDAGMVPEEVEYIAAHGTSTQLNDVSETRAIKAAFGAHAYRVPISANKSMLGHMFGAAGAISALACVLAIRTWGDPAHDQPGQRGPGVRPGLRAAHGAATAGARGHGQRLRLRRPERRGGLPRGGLSSASAAPAG